MLRVIVLLTLLFSGHAQALTIAAPPPGFGPAAESALACDSLAPQVSCLAAPGTTSRPDSALAGNLWRTAAPTDRLVFGLRARDLAIRPQSAEFALLRVFAALPAGDSFSASLTVIFVAVSVSGDIRLVYVKLHDTARSRTAVALWGAETPRIVAALANDLPVLPTLPVLPGLSAPPPLQGLPETGEDRQARVSGRVRP